MDPSLSNFMPMDLQTQDSSPCTDCLSSLSCLTSVCSDCLHSCSLWCQHCRPAVALSSHSGRNLSVPLYPFVQFKCLVYGHTYVRKQALHTHFLASTQGWYLNAYVDKVFGHPTQSAEAPSICCVWNPLNLNLPHGAQKWCSKVHEMPHLILSASFTIIDNIKYAPRQAIRIEGRGEGGWNPPPPSLPWSALGIPVSCAILPNMLGGVCLMQMWCLFSQLKKCTCHFPFITCT